MPAPLSCGPSSDQGQYAIATSGNPVSLSISSGNDGSGDSSCNQHNDNSNVKYAQLFL